MNVTLKDGMIVSDTKTMLESLHGIDFNDIDGSIQKIFEEQYDIMTAQGQGKINAELMAAGIQWYLDTLARQALSEGTDDEYEPEEDEDMPETDNYPEGWDEGDFNY